MNRNQKQVIISLKPLKLDPQTRARVESNDDREYLLKVAQNVAIVGLNGQRFGISAARVMLDDDFRIRPEFVDEVVADAVRQAVRQQHPDRKHLEIDTSCARPMTQSDLSSFRRASGGTTGDSTRTGLFL